MTTAINYDEASPEMLEELEADRDSARVIFLALDQQCKNLRTVLGLDNPENLTYTDLKNKIFFELVEAEPTYTEEYSANQAAHETELKMLALEVARFENESGN